jgi:alanine racemase
MDMVAVDVTGRDEVRVGSAVEFWGKELPVDEIATAAGTIAYEVLCGLAPRVPVVER